MRKITLLSVLTILSVLLAACGSAPTALPTLPVPVTGNTDTPVPVITDTAAATEAPTEASTATEAATEITGNITISTSTNASVAEPFLVDSLGRAIYVFANDTQNSGTSACTGDCATTWLPVVVTATPTGGEGVDSALLGTITRDDGTMQATYNGWPLYYYSGDAAPGDIMGQGMESLWYLVSAAGSAIK